MIHLVLVRYFAGARAAAGAAEEHFDLADLAGRATVADVLATVRARHGDRLAKVLAACSFLLNGVAVHDETTPVPAESELDVLPPFAGG